MGMAYTYQVFHRSDLSPPSRRMICRLGSNANRTRNELPPADARNSFMLLWQDPRIVLTTGGRSEGPRSANSWIRSSRASCGHRQGCRHSPNSFVYSTYHTRKAI